MRRVALLVSSVLLISGCGTVRKSSLLLERYARGSMSNARSAGRPVSWHLEPQTQTQTQEGIEVTVTYASAKYLHELFNNKELFGEYAGPEPYFPENLVFYVKIANKSEKRIRVVPADFVLLDDRGDQFAPLNVDYVTAYAEYRAPASTLTRGLLEDARPGYFGLSVPVGKIIAAKPQGRFALIQQSSIQMGYSYPGVTQDGLIAFWNPGQDVKSVKLLLNNIKTDFDANDKPRATVDFTFPFNAAANQ